MPIKKCRICKKEFYAKPFWIKLGKAKYCSNKCSFSSRRTGKNKECFVCGKSTYKTPKQISHSKSGKFFCSKSCQTRWRNTEFVGSKHANWKHGEQSYKSVLTRHKIKKICRLCATKDERVMAVHHLDRNRKNNKVDNLVWLCHNCHHLVHHHKSDEDRLMEALV